MHDMIRVSDTTRIRHKNMFILIIVGYDTLYMYIEKCTIYFKNMTNILMLLFASKLKSQILKLST